MTAYLVAFVVGGIAVLASLLVAEFDVGGAGHPGHGDGLPFLSLTSIAAALLGAGTGGLIATWAGLAALPAGGVAAGSAAVLLGVLQGLVLPYLRRQQANSHTGRQSYVGRLGTVTLEIPADGWGEIAFVDADGNRVRARAVTAEPHALPKAARVYIAEADADVVHVVAIPEEFDPDRPFPSERY